MVHSLPHVLQLQDIPMEDIVWFSGSVDMQIAIHQGVDLQNDRKKTTHKIP